MQPVSLSSVVQPLLPPSLLPLLHDCLDHIPTLWYAELEAIYQSVEGWRAPCIPLVEVSERAIKQSQNVEAFERDEMASGRGWLGDILSRLRRHPTLPASQRFAEERRNYAREFAGWMSSLPLPLRVSCFR